MTALCVCEASKEDEETTDHCLTTQNQPGRYIMACDEQMQAQDQERLGFSLDLVVSYLVFVLLQEFCGLAFFDRS